MNILSKSESIDCLKCGQPNVWCNCNKWNYNGLDFLMNDLRIVKVLMDNHNISLLKILIDYENTNKNEQIHIKDKLINLDRVNIINGT